MIKISSASTLEDVAGTLGEVGSAFEKSVIVAIEECGIYDDVKMAWEINKKQYPTSLSIQCQLDYLEVLYIFRLPKLKGNDTWDYDKSCHSWFPLIEAVERSGGDLILDRIEIENNKLKIAIQWFNSWS